MAIYPLHQEREIGEYGMSIPTDLAVAGSIGKHPDNPLTYRPIDPYREIWCNLATLVRNAYGSHTTDDQKRLDSQHLIDDVEQDLQGLYSFYTQVMPDDKMVRVRFYHNNYSKIGDHLPRAIPRAMKTDLQRQTFLIQEGAVNGLLKMYGESIDRYRFALKGNHGKVALLTHQPVDLLSRSHFQELALLESHTGKIKTRETWYTKFGRDDRLKRIPFNKAMVQIFGDGNNLLAMYPAKVRKYILDLAEKRKWTYMTTREKILSNVESEKELELLLLLREAFR